jgi:NADH:ubiquinone oxidoreductase subunit K
MIEIGLVKYLVIGFSILVISFLGIIVNRSNIIITFLSIEMMLLSINFIFIIYSRFLDKKVIIILLLFTMIPKKEITNIEKPITKYLTKPISIIFFFIN